MSTTNSPFRRKGFLAATVGVGIILLAAIVVLVTTLLGSPDETPSTSAPTSSPNSSSSADPVEDPSVCGLEAFETEDTLSGAPDVEWELIGTVAAPSSESAGPGSIDEGFRTCYAHTAEGALVMAANFLAMGSDATLGDRLLDLVAPGPGRDALASELGNSSSSSTRAQIAGFAIGAYSEDAATVDLAMNYSDGTLISIPMKLLWVEGDWKVEVTATGEYPLAPAQLDNLGGYTPWSGA
ncbi:hypothetical protein [Mycetocola zhujimingii]|uniref:hypothetical protein n=1 Tax=Mycetocola zhujimingii TaxID=2079792 RepID=UPI000D398DBB|nr:hypothetical protein [Mycetocola zhujimingii]AWB88140.1 hypothetical protein C3E77_15300 [Mycetocola zhujimingii]